MIQTAEINQMIQMFKTVQTVLTTEIVQNI
jgi:hypothetical protein